MVISMPENKQIGFQVFKLATLQKKLNDITLNNNAEMLHNQIDKIKNLIEKEINPSESNGDIATLNAGIQQAIQQEIEKALAISDDKVAVNRPVKKAYSKAFRDTQENLLLKHGVAIQGQSFYFQLPPKNSISENAQELKNALSDILKDAALNNKCPENTFTLDIDYINRKIDVILPSSSRAEKAAFHAIETILNTMGIKARTNEKGDLTLITQNNIKNTDDFSYFDALVMSQLFAPIQTRYAYQSTPDTLLHEMQSGDYDIIVNSKNDEIRYNNIEIDFFIHDHQHEFQSIYDKFEAEILNPEMQSGIGEPHFN